MHSLTEMKNGLLTHSNRKASVFAIVALAHGGALRTVTAAHAQKVTGGGKGILHSDVGDSPVTFSLNGIVCAVPADAGLPGSIAADGTVNFVICGPLAASFGADIVHLQGRVTSADVTSNPDTVILYGTLSDVATQ